MTQKAMIAMSGGVDSSVAAYLAKQQWDCMGATMRLCPGMDDPTDAIDIAKKLDIPFQVFDCREAFSRFVMDSFAKEYEAGLTPNPCVICNRHMKFGLFLQRAMELGCAYIVTGHYARILKDPNSGRYLLAKAADSTKDQSYFLYALTQEQLRHVSFPLGNMSKAQVRQLAQEQGFLNARKKDSQDICFVPDGDYMSFLRKHTGKTYPHGDFLDRGGNVVGKHNGLPGYTIGQRKGLGIALGTPAYVCAKDPLANTVTVGTNEDLMAKGLLANDWFFFPFPALTKPIRIQAKTRSRMIEQPATAYPMENGYVRVEFDSPQRAITPGQAVVLYDQDLVIGGGTITQVI